MIIEKVHRNLLKGKRNGENENSNTELKHVRVSF